MRPHPSFVANDNKTSAHSYETLNDKGKQIQPWHITESRPLEAVWAADLHPMQHFAKVLEAD